jgi:glycosyltransferase involved in cell wall biosynthesis
MKKKLIIFMPSIEKGGVGKNFFAISNFLTDYIEKITIITANNNHNNKINNKIFIKCPSNNFWNNKKRIFKYIICIYLFICEIINTKDKIIILSFQANLFAIVIAKIFNKKIIVRTNSSPTSYINNKIKKVIFYLILRLADKIIVNSKDAKKYLYKILKLKSECIYNPCSVQLIKKQANQIINFKFFKKYKGLKIITIGRLSEEKDHLTLLKAFTEVIKIKNARLLILGSGNYKKQTQDYININKLNKYVKIIDHKDNPYPYLKMSDLFILTSKFEGLPNVLLESLALKKYIISTDCLTGPKEILANGKYGDLIKIGNYKELYHAIIKFKKNAYFVKKINDGYKSLFRFNYSDSCKKYLNYINQY